MKKYRLTKITVKTREIISAQKNTTNEIQTPVCPICHSPIAKLSPVEVSDDQIKKLKGDL